MRFPITVAGAQFAADLGDLLKVIGSLIVIGTLLVKLVSAGLRRMVLFRKRQTLTDRLGAEYYTRDEIRRATSCYVEPDLQSVDPSGGEDFRRVIAARETAFKTLDRILGSPSEHRFIIILADSGMGKTSLLLNYYSYHWRSHKRRKRFSLTLVPLNLRTADQAINAAGQDRRNTVLFLDSLDEDRKAIDGHEGRIEELLRLSEGFRTVVITCRTQFFLSDQEIPVETGVLRVGAVRPGESRGYDFHKLYLSPFTDVQIDSYLRKRFPFHCFRQRGLARQMVKTIPDLVARPMLLAHVEDLVIAKRQVTKSFEVYEEMVNAWLDREKGLVYDKAALRKFSEELAFNIIENRATRGMERVKGSELEVLAQKQGLHLKGWQLRGRSLLNRDAGGNYKFAHRSILEYLFVVRFLRAGVPKSVRPWTDLMKTFLLEICQKPSAGTNLANADLSGCNASGADFRATTLTSVDFRGAILDRAVFRRVNLEHTDFFAAVLLGADFCGANLKSCNFRGAMLSSPSFTPEGEVTHGYPTRFKVVFSREVDGKISEIGIVNRKEWWVGFIPRDPVSFREAALDGADLSQTDLSEVTGLTQGQIDRAMGDWRTVLPAHLTTPSHWQKAKNPAKAEPASAD